MLFYTSREYLLFSCKCNTARSDNTPNKKAFEGFSTKRSRGHFASVVESISMSRGIFDGYAPVESLQGDMKLAVLVDNYLGLRRRADELH